MQQATNLVNGKTIGVQLPKFGFHAQHLHTFTCAPLNRDRQVPEPNGRSLTNTLKQVLAITEAYRNILRQYTAIDFIRKF
jgi:hypothetical protein